MFQHRFHNIARKGGFTLAELIIALMVTAIILSAVASLAYALGSANKATSEIGQAQAVLRYANVRIADVIKHSNRVCSASATAIRLWSDQNGDAVEEASEYFDITTNLDATSLVLTSGVGAITLISDCSNVCFVLDKPAPNTELISISFDLEENDIVNTYNITAALRCSN